ncbi:MAG: hypothetical protein HY865_22060 [Chloroflexi bacterium]|nr:hypothetical protein [Chloroflexota bacterium]
MNTTEIMTPQEVRDMQTIVPDWMEKILTEAEEKNKRVEVTRQHTPFGTYTVGITIAEENEGEGETPSPLTFN